MCSKHPGSAYGHSRGLVKTVKGKSGLENSQYKGYHHPLYWKKSKVWGSAVFHFSWNFLSHPQESTFVAASQVLLLAGSFQMQFCLWWIWEKRQQHVMQYAEHSDGHHKVTKRLRSIGKSKEFRSATWLPQEMWMSYTSRCFLACNLCFVSHTVTHLALSEGMQYTNTNRHSASIICLIKSFLFLEKVYKTDVLHRINN